MNTDNPIHDKFLHELMQDSKLQANENLKSNIMEMIMAQEQQKELISKRNQISVRAKTFQKKQRQIALKGIYICISTFIIGIILLFTLNDKISSMQSFTEESNLNNIFPLLIISGIGAYYLFFRELLSYMILKK